MIAIASRLVLLRFRIRPALRSMHAAVGSLAIVGIALAATNCTRVNPRSDFDHTEEAIRKRLGVSEVYDPTTEALIEQQLDRLITGGLTPEEAVTIALLNNKAFQALFQTIGASRAEVVQSGLVSNPSLMIGARFPEAGGRSELTFGFAQQLVDLWQIPVRRRLAEAELKRTIMAVLNEAVLIATETRRACQDLLWRQRAESLTLENLEVANQSIVVAEKRLNAGDANPLEVGLVRTKAFETRNALWAAERERMYARLALGRLLGLARSSRDWHLVNDWPTPAGELVGDDDLVRWALEQRFDVRLTTARVEAAADRLDLEWLKVFPNVQIGLNGERTERRALPGRKILADTARASVAAGRLTAPTIESKGQRDLVRRQFIDSLLGPSIQLTLPVWDQNQAQIAKAGFDLARELKQQDDLMDSVAVEVRRASTDFRIALQRVRYFESTVLPQVERNLKSARSLYESGAESVVILLEAQDDEFLQKRAALAAHRELLVALSELQGAAGGRLPPAASSQPTTSKKETADNADR